MRRTAWAMAVVVLGAALVFATGACGSGGTSTSVDPLTFWSGTYCFLAFGGENAAPDVATTTWGTVVSDGAGGIVGGATTDNSNGAIGAPMPVTPGFSYAVDAAGRMTWRFGGVPGWQGGVTGDGRAACLASIAATDPQIFLLLRKAGVFGNASLNGAYHFLTFFHNAAGPVDGAEWGTMNFDGGGNFSVPGAMGNNDGGIGPIAPPAAAYSVMADGRMTLDYAGGLIVLEGGVLLGGDLVVLAGGTTGSANLLMVLLRKGAGLTNAAFAGSYHMVSIVSPNGGVPQWRSITRTATADGAGSLSVAAGTQNEDKAVSASGAFALAYSVGADGTLDVGLGSFAGGVSPGGHFAAFAGGVTGGSDPQLHVLFR